MTTGWADYYDRERARGTTFLIGTSWDPDYHVKYAFCVSTKDIPEGSRNEWILVQKKQQQYSYSAYVWVDSAGIPHFDESMEAWIVEDKTVHNQRGIVPVSYPAGPGEYDWTDVDWRPARPGEAVAESGRPTAKHNKRFRDQCKSRKLPARHMAAR